MKVRVMFLLLILASVTGYYFYLPKNQPVSMLSEFNKQNEARSAPRVEVVAENLTIPWEILWLPDGKLLVTERSGNVLLLREGVTIPIPGVQHVGEGGLLGAALHPDFESNHFVYLYQTTLVDAQLSNRIVRYILKDNDLVLDRVVVSDLPGARNHDGGRIAFGPDGFLYVTVGDAGNEAAAQDRNNLAGSILRYTAEGEVPADNPFGTAVYSYGHRNPQGLAWDEQGNLWSTEHGRSGVRSGYDELNLVLAGMNYGWPDSEGDENREGHVAPKLHSGASTTWAPGGLAYLNGRLYFGGLRGETLYEAVLEGSEVIELREHLVGEYGRLRTVSVGPDGLLYVTTSNRDGRGSLEPNDDRLLRINPALLE
jgi:glucose/arabinose dehydrogenase